MTLPEIETAPPAIIGLVQIAQVNWAHRKREQFCIQDGIITEKKSRIWAETPGSFVYIPYAVGALQAYVQRYAPDPRRYRWLTPVFKSMPTAEVVSAMAQADVVGFSTYVWNLRQNLAAARELKRLRPDRVIVFGGPEVPARAEAFLRAYDFIDVACHGEAESVFLDVLENSAGRTWAAVPSTSHIAPDGRFVTTSANGRTKDLSRFPSPYLEGVFDDMMRANPGQGWLAMWETNRGCPYSCTYCDWGSAVASKVYRFDMERLRAEMDWFARNKIRFLFICDANFGILPRDVEIARYLVETYERHGSFVNISIQNAKNQVERTYEIQRILSQSNVATFGATIAMQGVALDTLKAIKRDNISLTAFSELQRRFRRDGMDTYTDVIVGLPGETYESFADGLDQIISNGQHNRMTSYNCSVLVNAEMGDPAYQARYGVRSVPMRIVYQHDSIALSEAEHVQEFIDTIIATSSLSVADWRRVRVFAWLTELLHFNRLLQLPLLVMAGHHGFSYRSLVEAFAEADSARFPLIADIVRRLRDHAGCIQSGRPEFIASPEYLGIWWPADQFVLVQMVAQRQLDAFYAESNMLLCDVLRAYRPDEDDGPLSDAIRLNQAMFRVPECFTDAEVTTGSNVGEFCGGVVAGEDVELRRVPHRYHIERTGTVWLSLEAWATDVVLQVYQRGQYLYPMTSAGPQPGPAVQDAAKWACVGG